MDFYVTSHEGYPARLMPPGYHWLFPASSWFDNTRRRFKPLRLPLHIDYYGVDCGGFVASRIWGDYRYSADQYIEWIETFLLPPQWAAIQDFCCEDELTAGKSGIIKERQDKTTANIIQYWQKYREAEWVWIPTVQGWQIEDYIRHALELKPLIMEWFDYYRSRAQDDLFRVGIGTLCARPFSGDIQAIVNAVADILPGVRFHLFGVKLQVLKSQVALPRIASVDSAAWNGIFGKDRHLARDEYTRNGITKSYYELNVALPRYMAKVERALKRRKQLTLWA